VLLGAVIHFLSSTQRKLISLKIPKQKWLGFLFKKFRGSYRLRWGHHFPLISAKICEFFHSVDSCHFTFHQIEKGNLRAFELISLLNMRKRIKKRGPLMIWLPPGDFSAKGWYFDKH
jgi:hypothetical protein